MIYLSCREVVSSRAYFPSQSETHVQFLSNICLTSNIGQCCHKTDEERALTGTWVIDEVWLGVQNGYSFLEICEFMNIMSLGTNPKLGKVVCLLAT